MGDVYRSEAPAITLAPTKKHCYACAAILDVRAELCPLCGVRQPVLPDPTAIAKSTKDKGTAGLLAILLGGLGLHKFYLGETTAGVIYLVFCWTFIPALIGFIEGCILLSMSNEAFAAKYPN